MSTATLWAGWDRYAPRALAGPLAPARGASQPGVPFMPDTFGPDARLLVEIAWGADLTADPDTWSWTDITPDVLQADGNQISITIGRGDEASTAQPARAAMLLDNRQKLYSLGGESPNWPNVRENVPVRVRIDLGAGHATLFHGFANGFVPRWDASGNKAVASLSASGVTRRLAQGATPLLSPGRRRITTVLQTAVGADILAWWPLEDREDTTAAELAFGPDTSTSTVYDGGSQLVTPGGDTTAPGGARAYTISPGGDLYLSLNDDDSVDTSWAVMLTIKVDPGKVGAVHLDCNPGGNILLSGWAVRLVLNADGTADVQFDDLDNGVNDLTIMSITVGAGGWSLNEWHHYIVSARQNGANVDFTLWLDGVQASTVTRNSTTLLSLSAIHLTGTQFAGGDAGPFAVSHAIIMTGYPAAWHTDTVDAISDACLGHRNETATQRLARVCTEEAIHLDIDGTSTTVMGPQPTATLLGIVRECETADQGFLYDGINAGFTYVTREYRENATAGLTLDAAAGDIPHSIEPVHDDQRIRNRVTVSQPRGASYTYTDETGPLGTDVIGAYDEDVQVNDDDATNLINQAAWRVHLGTVEGYRYPRLPLDLRHAPHQAQAWLLTRPGGRIDMTNLNDVRAQHPLGTVSVLLEGYTQALNQVSWMIETNCSPYEPWRIGVIAADTGDTGENVLRVDTDGSSLVDGVPAGATTLTVAITSGGIWTTLADDFPLEIDLGGIPVTVTAITGASSPQTFTVTGSTVTVPKPGGTPVKLWRPPVVGLAGGG